MSFHKTILDGVREYIFPRKNFEKNELGVVRSKSELPSSNAVRLTEYRRILWN